MTAQRNDQQESWRQESWIWRGPHGGDRSHLIDRRTLLTEFGKGVIGVAVFGAAGLRTASEAAAPSSAAWQWARADLGFVSAYVLVRNRQAVVVDTGVSGSSAAILKAAKTVGITSWSAIRHVILTHNHPDHAGSVAAVMKSATKATAYAGAADVAGITSPRKVRALNDGDDVFGLRIVATPGHTPGSISVLEPTSGVLVAGDAMGTNGSTPIGPNSQFTRDMDEANRSVAKLAKLQFATLLVGHGAPITSGASAAVAKLAGA